MQKRVYTAGPMTGRPEFNYPAFFAAQRQLESEGYIVENPAANDADTSKPREYYLRMAAVQVAKCDAICLLDGWQDSRGVIEMELPIAQALGLEIFEYTTRRAPFHIPKTVNFGPEIEIRQFPTGAQRNNAAGKGRFDLLPVDAIFAVAKHYEKGALKFGDNNWRRGIPINVLLDSGIRHAFQALRGDTDEDHLAAAAWNILCAIETRDVISKSGA